MVIVLTIRALMFGVYIRVPDFWKLPYYAPLNPKSECLVQGFELCPTIILEEVGHAMVEDKVSRYVLR